MPKQRMAGYTPLKGRAHDDDAAPLTQDAAPQPVAGSGVEETVAPATVAPAAVAASRDAVPYEQRQRMAGYTPFQGAAPQVQTAGVPEGAPAPTESPAPADAVQSAAESSSAADARTDHAPGAGTGAGLAAGAVGGAAVGGAVAAGASSGDSDQPAASETTPAARAAASGVPYEQRQRMAGYTPLKGGAPSAIAPAAGDSMPATAADQTTPAAQASAPQGASAAAAGAGAVAGGAVAAGATQAAANQDATAPAEAAQHSASVSAPDTDQTAATPAEAPAAPVGQRMKGYTPLKGGAAAQSGTAPAQADGAPAQESAAASAQTQPSAPEDQSAATTTTTAGTAAAATAAAATAGAAAAAAAGAAAQAPAGAGQKQRMGAQPAAQSAAQSDTAPASAPKHAAEPAAATPASGPQSAAQTQAGQTPAAQAPAAQTSAAQAPATQKGAAAQPAAGRKATGKPAAQPAKKAKDAEPMPLGRKVLWGVLGAVVVGLALVLAARGLRTLEPVQDFIAQYDGHTAQPESAPTGIPAWLGWQHFLNMFLMVLIIRTGLQIRSEQRPPANFTPRKDSLFSAKGNTPKKYSMTIWMHQALDGLWVLNGLIFVVLLFVTGQWMRIVPTDPYVFHHALSAGVQYLSLDWPSENGWIHYNALQMIAYTLVVFAAAPLAALTGWRMSSWFPAEAKGLNRAFPMEAARKVHFPVMLFFVGFILVHVFLVFFTGVLANLNHMYTSREATDFWGLIVFLVSVAVTAAAWFFLRPQFVAPVAQRFGTVGR